MLNALPKITFGEKPELSVQELNTLLSLNLSEQDKRHVKALRFYVDLYNIRAFWKGMPLDIRGTMNEKELEESILVKDFLPNFVIEYLEKYESREVRLKNFSELLENFFQYAVAVENGFLRRYFLFEKEYRLVVTALRAQRLKRNLEIELKNEDQKEYFVAQLLSQSQNGEVVIPEEYVELGNMFKVNCDDPRALDFGLHEFRFKVISNMGETGFGIDPVLNYLALYQIVFDMAGYEMDKKQEVLENLFRG